MEKYYLFQDKKYKAKIHWETSIVEKAMNIGVWSSGLSFNSTQVSQGKSFEILQ